MKEDRPENIAAKEAENVMRRFSSGVKVENGEDIEVVGPGLAFWSSIFEGFVFRSSVEAITDIVKNNGR